MNIWIINHYVIPPNLGGLNRHYFFAKELIKRGHSVKIFTSSVVHNTEVDMMEDDRNKFKQICIDEIPFIYVKSSKYKGNGLDRIKNMLGFAWDIRKIKRYMINEKPDIIYTSSPDIFTARASEKLAKKYRIPCIVEVRDLWPLSIVEYKKISEKHPVIRLLYQYEKNIYEKANALIFTMPGGKDYIKEKGWEKQVSLDKIFNINNGIDYSNCASNELEYWDENLENDLFKVIYAGSIRSVNDIGMLVDVAKNIQDISKDIKFLIYGDGDQREGLIERCKVENIRNIVFKGRVDKCVIPYICGKADLNIINVKPTKVSNYGVSWNKLFDYMAAGKPILSTLKVKYDILEKYDCGVSLEEQSVTSITNAILMFYNMDSDRYNEMCRNAKEGVKDYYYNVLTDKLEKVIEFAITGKE